MSTASRTPSRRPMQTPQLTDDEPQSGYLWSRRVAGSSVEDVAWSLCFKVACMTCPFHRKTTPPCTPVQPDLGFSRQVVPRFPCAARKLSRFLHVHKRLYSLRQCLLSSSTPSGSCSHPMRGGSMVPPSNRRIRSPDLSELNAPEVAKADQRSGTLCQSCLALQWSLTLLS
jgi:hypothetical protein